VSCWNERKEVREAGAVAVLQSYTNKVVSKAKRLLSGYNVKIILGVTTEKLAAKVKKRKRQQRSPQGKPWWRYHTRHREDPQCFC